MSLPKSLAQWDVSRQLLSPIVLPRFNSVNGILFLGNRLAFAIHTTLTHKVSSQPPFLI